MNQEELKIEYVPLDSINGWARNYKEHDIDQISESFKRFGFVNPIIVDEKSGKIVAGHGRIDALRELKESGEEAPGNIKIKDDEWLVPVVRGVYFKDEGEGEAYLITDNRTVEIGGKNEELLAEMLRDLANSEKDNPLQGTGYDQQDIDFMIQQANPSEEENIGKLPTEIYETYAGGSIKQIVLYFDAEEYEKVLERLEVIMDEEGLDSHTEVFLKMLTFYESDRRSS